MKIFNTILGIVMTGSCISQVNTTILDHNNTSGIISDHGFFFNDPGNSSPGYEIPSGSGNHAIYSGAFWFKGENINGFRYLIAPDLFGASYDLKPGPCGGYGVYFDDPNPLNETMWTVSRVEIENHIQNFNQPGYVIPNSIETWPAHGDSSAGYNFYLAPFVDANSNSIYEPDLGDYPCIKGDKATYTIMNDLTGFGLPMRLEIHYMFYQFHSGGFLDNTTFIDVDVYNRGVTHFYDFKMSFVQDGDLGNPFDDFYGCDSSANLIYSYNGDSMDENFGGIQGYGLNAPSVGTICLSHDIESAMSFTDIWWAPDAFPASEQEKWSVMDGVWAGGANITDDNGQATKFQYSGNPNSLNEWSELGSGNQPGNRKSMMTVSDGIVLEALYGHKTYTCAIVYNRSGNSAVENVNGLLAVADSVQGFYDLYLESQCNPSIMSVSEPESLEFQMYPNPSNGSLNIDLMGNEEYSISILDMAGRIMYTSAIEKNKVVLDLDFPSGIYLVQVETENYLATKKLIID